MTVHLTRLREMRSQKGITLRDLGRTLGKSKQYLSELERGNIRLSYEMAERIAIALDTTPDAIFFNAQESKEGGHSAIDRLNLTAKQDASQ